MDIQLNSSPLTRPVIVRDMGELKTIDTVGRAALFLSNSLAAHAGELPYQQAKKALMDCHADSTEARAAYATDCFESLCRNEGVLAT